MSTSGEHTLPEKILLAAFQLEEEGTTPFTAEALTVEAWQRYPRTFGLRGYHERHPDSNKVLTSLMGEKGLARKGWLVKVGQKLYALTHKGRQVVRQLIHRSGTDENRPRVIRLNPEHGQRLQHWLGSSIVAKYRRQQADEWTFAEACRFWGLTGRCTGTLIDQSLEKVGNQLAEIERQLGLGEAELAEGLKVSGEDTAMLDEVHRQLQDRFVRHLDLLRNRTPSQ